MNVNINTPLQRRCFTNTYTVQYCNEGTETAEDAYVEIYFEEEIIVLDASIPYTIDDINEIRANLKFIQYIKN